MTPDQSFLTGVARGVLSSFRCTCHVSAFGSADPTRLLSRPTRGHRSLGSLVRGAFAQFSKKQNEISTILNSIVFFKL